MFYSHCDDRSRTTPKYSILYLNVGVLLLLHIVIIIIPSSRQHLSYDGCLVY